MAISIITDFTNVTTFNGWTVIPFPLSPGFKSIEFTANDNVAQVAQPWTQQSQFQAWPGGDWWEGTITLPKMQRAQAAQWIAFLMSARGMANCFMIGDPTMRHPQGNPQGVPLVDGSNASNNGVMTSVLVTKGWTPNVRALLMPGDYVQVGLRMHVVLNMVNSDTNGSSTLQLWPSLREKPVDGLQLICSNVKGLFRLASNKRTWGVDETRLFGLSFKISEAK